MLVLLCQKGNDDNDHLHDGCRPLRPPWRGKEEEKVVCCEFRME